MLLNSSPPSSDAIDDEEGADTIADGCSEDVAVLKDDPDDDNDADDDKEDEKDIDDDCGSNDAVGPGVVKVFIDKDGDEDDDSSVDCSSGISVGECKILPLI